jgi:hypothetical protein
VRTQYHFWPGTRGFDAWDVARLIRLTADLPVSELPLESIGEVDTVYWFAAGEDDLPTVRSIVGHVRLIQAVDPSYPIILGSDGRVMDGMHRIARALLGTGRRSPPSGSPPIPNPTIATAFPATCRIRRPERPASGGPVGRRAAAPPSRLGPPRPTVPRPYDAGAHRTPG